MLKSAGTALGSRNFTAGDLTRLPRETPVQPVPSYTHVMVTVHEKHFHACRTCRLGVPCKSERMAAENALSCACNRFRISKEETPLAFVKGFHKLSDVLDTICSYIIVVMLGAMVVITGAQIVCRMAFTALSWSEEATRYLLVWSSFLGASCVYKHSGHISITFVQDMVPAAFSKDLKTSRPCGLLQSSSLS